MTLSDGIVIGERRLGIEDVGRIARSEIPIRMSRDPQFVARLQRGADVIAQRIERGLPTYGVNTGYGASVRNTIPASAALTLAQNLPRYHGCGVGPDLSYEESRAVMAVRVNSLAAGFSGVRPVLVERLIALLAKGVAPVIPARGSVGASGDLTPLSYVAALVVGERRAWLQGEPMAASAALTAVGISPLPLIAKESMAIMNGTSVMSALACLACERVARLAHTASALTAMAIDAMAGQHSHFDARLFAAKAHPGQVQSAEIIRGYLGERARNAPPPKRIQERYSLRCAPHIIGVVLDALPFCRGVIETEINGASDNPLIDPDSGDVLHGGNFYGGHMAMVADLLKPLVAGLADLMDRQLLLLNEPVMSGLPENLVAVTGPERFAHHGFKAMEITASALTAEALKLSGPASAFSRSTEGHNQDKVSMGLLAVQDLQRILELTETVAAVHALACAQAIELRGLEFTSPALRKLHGIIRTRAAFMREDRPLDDEIGATLLLIQRGLELATGSPAGTYAEW